MNQRRAIFLDRDGVICANRADYVKTWDEFVFLPRALDALCRLAASDFVIAVTTNQSPVGRGLMAEATLREIHARMLAEIERGGGRIDAVYYCPHRAEDNCACRKPLPGMYWRAARDFGIDLARSLVVGDAADDVAAARAIGAQALLALTGRGKEQHAKLIAQNHSGYHVVDDLWDAVAWLARAEKISL